MTQSIAGRGGRVLGRGLLTLSNVITAAVPLAADWNDSHIFNKSWPAHARFHGVTALTMTTTLAAANIWSIWSRQTDQRTARFFAAAVPVAYWAPFFVAPLVPGTAVDDPPHPVLRLAGMPTNLLGAAATVTTAAAGWFIDHRSAPALSEASHRD
jgi:hypothetical protein